MQQSIYFYFITINHALIIISVGQTREFDLIEKKA